MPARPDLAIPPGEMLAEELAARGMTQRELARRTERPEQAISEIVNAKKANTPETALALEKVLGASAEFWLGLQTTYDLTLARSNVKTVLRPARTKTRTMVASQPAGQRVAVAAKKRKPAKRTR